MKIKRFEADSIPEALQQVKQEFGHDAVILQTRQYQHRKLLGLRGRPRAEVLAAMDVKVPARPVAPVRPRERQLVAEPAGPPRASAGASELEALRREVESLRQTLKGWMTSGAARTVEASEGLERLEGRGLPRDLAEAALAAAGSTEPAALASGLASLLTVAPPPSFDAGPQVVVLVGPTGSGKTTTIAKLAARFALAQGRSTALVTADTYRIGAVDQLRTYAEILKLPLEVAMTPAEVASARERHGDKDLVLVDTVGRSQRKAMHLSELAALVRAARPTEVHLTLPATSGLAVLEEVVDRFRPMSPTHLLLTKLDEAARPADSLAAAVRSGLPLSYLADGQTVPDDLHLADALRLAAQVLGLA